MAAAIEAGASEVEVRDMMEDMSMTRFVTDEGEKQEFIAAWKAAGVTCIVQNAGRGGAVGTPLSSSVWRVSLTPQT